MQADVFNYAPFTPQADSAVKATCLFHQPYVRLSPLEHTLSPHNRRRKRGSRDKKGWGVISPAKTRISQRTVTLGGGRSINGRRLPERIRRTSTILKRLPLSPHSLQTLVGRERPFLKIYGCGTAWMAPGVSTDHSSCCLGHLLKG